MFSSLRFNFFAERFISVLRLPTLGVNVCIVKENYCELPEIEYTNLTSTYLRWNNRKNYQLIKCRFNVVSNKMFQGCRHSSHESISRSSSFDHVNRFYYIGLLPNTQMKYSTYVLSLYNPSVPALSGYLLPYDFSF